MAQLVKKVFFSGVSTPVTAPTPTPPPTGEGLFSGTSSPNPLCGAIALRLFLGFLPDWKTVLCSNTPPPRFLPRP